MLTETLIELYKRDLNRLINELNLYRKEESLWLEVEGINNSGGNLCLHLIGNLKMFIGNVLGNSGYKRKREEEFTLKNIPREDLIKMINETKESVVNILSNLDPEMLAQEYPLKVFKEKMTVEYFIIHLSSHLTYHLGQMNYHRRILDK